MSTAPVLLDISGLRVTYPSPAGRLAAVRRVDLALHQGEAVALIGESGSGKSTLVSAIMRCLPRDARVERGEIRLFGGSESRNLLAMTGREFRRLRWTEIAMTSQAAQNTLNPVMRIGNTFWETARAHGWRDAGAVRKRTRDLLELVRLDPDRVYSAYPHELSGGMRQRISIALSLLLEPALLILDEPTTGLDVLTQRAIIDLVRTLHVDLNLTLLVVSHDLSLAAGLADSMATMYAGTIVEHGPVNDVFATPRHAYTAGLLRAATSLTGQQDALLMTISGTPPHPVDIPAGCPFHPRCPFRSDQCETRRPRSVAVGPDHHVACHHHDRVNTDARSWAVRR